MKNTLIITLIALSFVNLTHALTPEKTEGNKTTMATPDKVDKTKVVIEHLTNESFKKKVFNYTDNKDWKYEGDVPCIIDFYADWCMPCKRIAPILEELAQEYDGKILIYKVNTEKERELAGAFGIRSIPALLFVPTNGQPQMAQGALPKESFIEAINEVLLKKIASLCMKLFNFKEYTTVLSKDETIPVWKRILDNKLYRILIGILSGALLGLLYWNYVGCTNGTCPLTNTPYKTVFFFSLMGGLFAKDKKESKNTINQ